MVQEKKTEENQKVVVDGREVTVSEFQKIKETVNNTPNKKLVETGAGWRTLTHVQS